MNDQTKVDDENGAKQTNCDEERYVAYCDILGFSERVISDFEGTLDIYEKFSGLMAKMPFICEGVSITMYSDSILITAQSLELVLSAVQGLWFFALASDFMLRGGIAKGRYWERRQGDHLLVMSDALIRAVKLEKSSSIPAVVLADDIDVPDFLWLKQLVPGDDGVVVTSLLHFRDRSIVNPFNRYWLLSAGARAQSLMELHPVHRDKYLWFLALHAAVTERRTLVPQAVLNRLVEAGIIAWVPAGASGSEADEDK